jgi:chorismate mutase
MSESGLDSTVQRLREEISELDHSILDAVNARLELVAALRRHKETVGLPFVDSDRERQLLDALVLANRGPLSDEGLRELFCELLDLTKREVAGDGAPADH